MLSFNDPINGALYSLFSSTILIQIYLVFIELNMRIPNLELSHLQLSDIQNHFLPDMRVVKTT